MPTQQMTQESAPPRTDRPLRQVLVFLCATYAIAVAIALALPHAGVTPGLSIAAPVLGFAITMVFAVPRGQRGDLQLRGDDGLRDHRDRGGNPARRRTGGTAALSTLYQIPLAIAIGWIGLTLASDRRSRHPAAAQPGPTLARQLVVDPPSTSSAEVQP
jgi:hypothetical protein